MTITIRDLSVSFGGVQALTGLDATLDDGITGVIGPNGAGKTTLLNVFSGFVPARRGSITAFGTDLLALPPHRRARWGLRRSFQTEQVVDDLSVADNVRAVLDPLDLTRREKAAEIAAALAHVGLGPRARRDGRRARRLRAPDGRDRQGGGRAAEDHPPRRAGRGAPPGRGGAAPRRCSPRSRRASGRWSSSSTTTSG